MFNTSVPVVPLIDACLIHLCTTGKVSILRFEGNHQRITRFVGPFGWVKRIFISGNSISGLLKSNRFQRIMMNSCLAIQFLYNTKFTKRRVSSIFLLLCIQSLTLWGPVLYPIQTSYGKSWYNVCWKSRIALQFSWLIDTSTCEITVILQYMSTDLKLWDFAKPYDETFYEISKLIVNVTNQYTIILRVASAVITYYLSLHMQTQAWDVYKSLRRIVLFWMWYMCVQ